MHLGQTLQSLALHFFHLCSPDLLFGYDDDVQHRNIIGVIEDFPEIAKQGVLLRKFGQEVIRLTAGKRIHGTGAIPGGVNRSLSKEEVHYLQDDIARNIGWAQGAIELLKKIVSEHFDYHMEFGTIQSNMMSMVRDDGAFELYHGGLRARDVNGDTIFDHVNYVNYNDYIRESVKDWSYMKFPFITSIGEQDGWYRVGPLARINNCDYMTTPLADAARQEFMALGKGLPVQSTMAYHWARLIELLYSNISARRLAKDLMSSPAITVDSQVSCRSANDLLTRYNVNALLVTGNGDGCESLLGYITRQVIEKALFHGLDEIPVREYMTTEIATVIPESDLIEIQEKIIENKQRILPVLDHSRIIGVITRTDLLNILVRQSNKNSGHTSETSGDPSHARTRNVIKFMRERLSRPLLGVLKQIGEVAQEIDCGAFVVGGFVRDLFLYRADEDVDIVIEGDGIAFAKKYAAIAGARIHTYQKFGTAVITFPEGFKIDVASARMEYYKFPAALPIVEMSSIKLDLFRRDFTMNTLAIHLNPDKFGTLIDFFSASRRS